MIQNVHFARCQRSIIYSNQNKLELALADIEKLDSYTAPPWYLKFAGDILRKAGKFDLADAWLDRAMQADPESADYINITRGEAEYDRGSFRVCRKIF